ncbi:MAG: THUMP-like domain-containing protein [Oscillochloridaceae bacterium umkhey_bin13]
MDVAILTWLRGPEGTAILAELAERGVDEALALPELERLRRVTTPERARAAFELSLLRRRAAAKFPQAERLYFTREALEQASAAPVAAQRAQRLALWGLVADLGCGIGGDALALAAAGADVIAVDRDPLRLALCQANAEVLGLAGQITTLERDLLREDPPPAEALFCDPGRRAGGKRRFDPASYEPPLSHLLAWRSRWPALAAKLAPGIERTALPADAELEFVSLEGQLKEAALWSGPLATTARRATLLQRIATGEHRSVTLSSVTASSPVVPITPPGTVLYEPDPAVIRAGLVTDLALLVGARQFDPQIAYLTADQWQPTPFARAWSVLEWLPFSLKALKARLRHYETGTVTVKKRGSPLDSDALAKQLSGKGSRALVVVLSQVQGRPAVIICEQLRRDVVE